MKLLAERTSVLTRPVSEVYPYATNLEHFGTWFPGVLTIESANPLPHGQVGKEYLETVRVPLRGARRIVVTVKEAIEHRRFVTEGRFPPLLPRMEMLFDVAGRDSTRVTWRMYSRSRSRLVQLLLVPLARRVMQRRADAGLAKLGALLQARR